MIHLWQAISACGSRSGGPIVCSVWLAKYVLDRVDFVGIARMIGSAL
jgi:hypothetical protein